MVRVLGRGWMVVVLLAGLLLGRLPAGMPTPSCCQVAVPATVDTCCGAEVHEEADAGTCTWECALLTTAPVASAVATAGPMLPGTLRVVVAWLPPPCLSCWGDLIPPADSASPPPHPWADLILTC